MSPPPPEKGKVPVAGDRTSSGADGRPRARDDSIDPSESDLNASENAVVEHVEPGFVRDGSNLLETPKADATQESKHQERDQTTLPKVAGGGRLLSDMEGSSEGSQANDQSQESTTQASQVQALSAADSLSEYNNRKLGGDDGSASSQSGDEVSRSKVEALPSATDDRFEDAANALALGNDDEVATAQYAAWSEPPVTVKSLHADDSSHSAQSRGHLKTGQMSPSANAQGTTTKDQASKAESNSASTDDEDANGREDPSKAVQRMMVDRVMSSFMDWLDLKLKVKEEDEKPLRLQDIKPEPVSVASTYQPQDMPIPEASPSRRASIKQLPVPPPPKRMMAAPRPPPAVEVAERSSRSTLFARMKRSKKETAPLAPPPPPVVPPADAFGSSRTSTGEEATKKKKSLKTGSLLGASPSHGTEKLEQEGKRSRLRGLLEKRKVKEPEGVDLYDVSPMIAPSSHLAQRFSRRPSSDQSGYAPNTPQRSQSGVQPSHLYAPQAPQAPPAPTAPAAPAALVPVQAAPPPPPGGSRELEAQVSSFDKDKNRKAEPPVAAIQDWTESMKECEEEDDEESVDLSLDFAVFDDVEDSFAGVSYALPTERSVAPDYMQPPMLQSAVPLTVAARTTAPRGGSQPDTSRQPQRKSRKAGSSAAKRDRSNDESKEQEGEGNEDEDGNQLPRAKLPRVQEDKVSGAKLACPFFKHNPRKYKNMRPCCGPGWDHVHRIKEHIYRKHSLPKFSCPRCSQPFETQADLQAHARSPDPCEVREPEILDGITQDQEKKLRSRKKTTVKELTEAEKWAQVYSILFPDVREREIPSPYYTTEDAQTTLGGYEDYLRRELPPLVRRQLEKEVERELSFVEEGMKQKVIEIARNLQLTLFKGYQQLENQERGTEGPSPSMGDVSGSESGGYSSFATTNTSPSTMTTQGTTPEVPDPLEIFSDPAIPDFDFGFLSQVPYPSSEGQSKALGSEFEFINMSGIPEQSTIQPGMEFFPGQQVELPYYGTEGYDDGQGRATNVNALSYVP